MQQLQISHSPDLIRLKNEGFELEICGGHLLVHHIPYVTPSKEIKYGILVCILNLSGPTRLGKPGDHTIYFSGETPCTAEGCPLDAIINNSILTQLNGNITVNHFFSSKPLSGYYENYYDKIITYSRILSTQAFTIDRSVTAKPGKNQ
jgi:hypothetical protein